jgi:aralkylamine N-acetyltransferase
MNVTFTEDVSIIDWEQLASIFKRTPLGNREPQRLKDAFTNSGVRCFVWYEDQFIGAGRAITDGIVYAVIFDVVLLPEYQGKGIGKRIMHFLAERSKAGNVMLQAVPGKEEFYLGLGYRKMKTAMGRFANPDRQQQAGYIE